MTARSLVGLLASATAHGALVTAALVLSPRAEVPPPLFVDLTLADEPAAPGAPPPAPATGAAAARPARGSASAPREPAAARPERPSPEPMPREATRSRATTAGDPAREAFREPPQRRGPPEPTPPRRPAPQAAAPARKEPLSASEPGRPRRDVAPSMPVVEPAPPAWPPAPEQIAPAPSVAAEPAAEPPAHEALPPSVSGAAAPAEAPTLAPARDPVPWDRDAAPSRGSGALADARPSSSAPGARAGGGAVGGGGDGSPSSAAAASGPASRVARIAPGADGAGAEYGPWLGRLRERIQASLRYPASARRRGLSGTVTLELTIRPTGAIDDVRVVESSSHSVLDTAAVDAVRALPAQPMPPELEARPLRVRLPVVFRLR